MHVEKYKKSQVSSVINHDLRTIPNHTNEDINPTKSHLNYNLHPGNPYENLKIRLSEVKYLKMAKANVMASWAITCPAALVGSSSQGKFFEAMYEFMAERYGRTNVVSAIVHLDETTPHMHFKFIPVAVVGLEEKLSARTVINRTDLKQIHREAELYCEKIFGLEGLILNGATAGGNKTITELKLERAQQKFIKVSEDLEKTKVELAEVKETLKTLTVDLKQIQPLPKVKKIPFMGEVVSVSDYNQLAEDYNKLSESAKQLEKGIIYWKQEKTATEARLSLSERELFTLRKEEGHIKARALENQLKILQDEHEVVLENNEVLSEEIERLSFFEEFYLEFVGNVSQINAEAQEFIRELLPVRFVKDFFENVYAAASGWFRDLTR